MMIASIIQTFQLLPMNAHFQNNLTQIWCTNITMKNNHYYYSSSSSKDSMSNL
uniref:Uncharacterized protein n=1 Tax=Lepeophtheirus salmonis TaxID=72036 RepID=A0A0K2VHY6_LEPSM